MNIKTPCAKDIPALRALWREAFGDSDEFLDAFFERAYSEQRALCVTDGECLLAALYWFDCECLGRRVAYIYAVATAKKHRGKGISTLLINEVHRRLAEEGYAGAMLVPGEEGLFGFYRRFGYRNCGSVREFSIIASEHAIQLRLVDASEYAEIRRSLLPYGGVIQERENLSFLSATHLLYAGEGFVLAARREGDFLYAAELLGNTAAAPDILCALGCREGRFRTVGKERRFAMYRHLSGEHLSPSYLGFAFD